MCVCVCVCVYIHVYMYTHIPPPPPDLRPWYVLKTLAGIIQISSKFHCLVFLEFTVSQ